MSQESTPNNQAERLRQKIEKIKDEGIQLETNVLPSRTDLHRHKKNKTKLKIKFPVIRLLVLFFILLPIVIISAYNSLGMNTPKTTETLTNPTNDGNEEIYLEVNNKKEESKKSTEIEEFQSPSDNSFEGTLEEGTLVNSKEEESELDIEVEELISQPDQNEASSEKEIIYHTVQASETLFRIAMNYYQSKEGIKIIQQANGLQGNEIKIGQVLKIPQ
jgi:LysM repeat protein